MCDVGHVRLKHVVHAMLNNVANV